MNVTVSSVIVASLVTLAAGDSTLPSDSDDADPWLSARAILIRVMARLPAEPLRIDGDIDVRRRKGVVTQSLAFDMDLEWGRAPARARYVVRDRFGGDPERLTVTHAQGRAPVYTFERGDPWLATDVPDLSSTIRGTDIGWADLALDYLWWPNARVTGDDEVRGRACTTVDVDAPASGGTVRQVRLWIDRELDVLLQAEAYDAAGALVRRFQVRSVKKIDDRWMIKDVDVQGASDVQRTRLRVRNVRPLNPNTKGGDAP